MLGRWRRAWPVVAGVGLLAVCALLDFVVPHGSWYAAHPMSSAALSGLLAFLAAGLFLDGWLREREAERLRRVSTVAYRSLAQFANDAGRGLLAPLTGADLHALGIPVATPEDVRVARDLLRARGHRISFAEVTGSWRVDHAALRPVLDDLLEDPGFVRRMFRQTAVARRRLQEATALWAPVMLTSTRSADDLGRLQELTDELELLQERWRLSLIIGGEGGPWWPEDEWRRCLAEQFWTTVRCYERIRDDFAELAKLPSDAIVRRRPTAGTAGRDTARPDHGTPAAMAGVG